MDWRWCPTEEGREEEATGLGSGRVGVRLASGVPPTRDGAISGRVFMIEPPAGREAAVLGKMTAVPFGAIGGPPPPPPRISFIMKGVEGLLRLSG